LSLAVKEDLIARNGKFVGYGFSRCEPKQEQLSPFSSSFLKRLVAKLAGKKKDTPDTLENRKKSFTEVSKSSFGLFITQLMGAISIE